MLHAGEIMSVFPCRISIETNIQFGLYCEPADRLSKVGSRFIGLYADKCVEHLACIQTVVTVVPDDDGAFVMGAVEKGTLSDNEQGRIRQAIERFVGCFESFSGIEQRFYLLDEIHETYFVKSSKYGLWRGRDFDLSNWLD